ncbi:hypothetical protein N0V82_006514 [Gnomoniopsis sp. IMI 355080]|nr:hypothetical protein N0V82_006514 [Gnomoniopsis sp. IMI 355080]
MQASSIITLLVVPCVAARYPVFQRWLNNATRVPSRVEDGIQTECKTCPYSQCTNIAAYEYDQSLNLTCWTRGDAIVETNVLPYCGKIAETYTQGPGKTVYNTECNIIPEFVGETADHTKMYKPEVDLTLTCKTTEGEAVLDNTNWYKTLSNCYVPEAEIEPVDADLDDCGPIPFMEAKMRQPDVPETDASAPTFARRDASQNKRWLYLTQMGEDDVGCLAEPNSASKARDTYPFGKYIVVQCATYSDNAADEDQCVEDDEDIPLPLYALISCSLPLAALIFLLTEDFCWVNDTQTDPQLIDDEERSERYPNCNLFTDTEG